jgi:hypothetical protein
MFSRVFWNVASIAVIGLVCFATGCSEGGGGPSTVKVTGKITHAGGAWDHPATLSFIPVPGATNDKPYSAAADVKSDGTFEVSLVPGKYQVGVQSWDSVPAENPNAKSLVPKQYESGSTSGLTLDVPSSGTVKDLAWDVPKA